MIKAEASGNGRSSYRVMISGFVDDCEYKQILENIEEITREIKAFGKEYGYEKEENNDSSL